MSISIVVDISERLRDFTKPDTDLTLYKIVFDYYPYFFIHYMNMFSSLIIFLSVLVFTSMMASRSEIIAILSNGVSFRRFTRPYILVSTLLLVFSLLSNHYWVPHANKRRIDFENKYVFPVTALNQTNLQIDDSTIIHYQSLSPLNSSVNRLWVENWKVNKDGVYEMYKDMQINLAEGDSLSKKWKLTKVFVRHINDSAELVKEFGVLDTVLHFSIRDLGFVNNAMATMTTDELIVFRDSEREKGSKNLTAIEIVLYERSALPFAAYILTLLGVAVASRKSREGVGKSIFIGLLICFLYIFFMKMTTVAATNVGLSPAIAVWVPNVIFAILAIMLYWNRMNNEEPPRFKWKFWK